MRPECGDESWYGTLVAVTESRATVRRLRRQFAGDLRPEHVETLRRLVRVEP